MRRSDIAFVAFVIAITACSPAWSDEPEKVAGEESEPRSRVGLFLGNTHNREDENAFSIGLSYEYRVAPLIGLGALAEHAAGDIESWILGAPFTLHPYRGLSLVAMPGAEISEDDTHFLFRLGIGYEFELDRHWALAPEFNADFVDSDIDYVFGFSLSYGF
jgi:hypothetical protein